MEYNTVYQQAKEEIMDNRIEILPDVFLTSVQTDKFKTGCFSVNLLRPMRREEASANALIPSILPSSIWCLLRHTALTRPA